MTEWRKIGDTDYFVSNDGGIKSGKTNKLLKPNKHSGGYRIVHLRHDGKRLARYVHRLVAEAFIDNPMALKEVNHLNFDRADNRLSNLEWCDRSRNISHALVAGRKKSVKRHKIRKEVHSMIGKRRVAEIAKHFGVDRSLIQNLAKEIFSTEQMKAMALVLRPKRERNNKGQWT